MHPASCTIMSAPSSPSDPSPSAPTSTTCHALPCNIEYTGKAPVDVYFRPAPIIHDEERGDGEQQHSSFQAATLRGRGLLAENCSDPNMVVHGRLLSVIDGHGGADPNKKQQRVLETVATFDRLTEWHHEHLVQTKKESRLRTALDWMETAAALHTPLPVAGTK